MNTARTEEKTLKASAMTIMVNADISVYRHARVELARVPGAEKLRVRMTKEEGDASSQDLKVSDAGMAPIHETDPISDEVVN